MIDYRNQALARLDVLAFFGSRVGAMKRLNDREHQFLCPFHGDKDPSANVNVETGLFFCHACGAKGTAIDLVMKQDNATYKEALAVVGQSAGMEPPSVGKRSNGHAGAAPAKPLTDAMVTAWHETAKRNADLMAWLHDHRGFSDETIAHFEVGWDGQRVTIPIRDGTGTLVNVRRYMRDSKGEAGKMLSYAPGMGDARLFPVEALDDAEVLLVEGEWDAMLARQYGFNAMTVTSGAGIWNADWNELFTGKQVTIAYDNDEAGRKGAVAVATRLSMNPGATVLIADIHGLPEKGDVTDFFVEQSRSADELRGILLDAKPFVTAPTATADAVAVRVPLGEASHARFRGQLLEVPVLMSGKTMTPFTVPYDFTVTCDMSNKRLCKVCPLNFKQGVSRVQIDTASPRVLELVNVTTAAQQATMKRIAGAVEGCNRGIVQIHSSTNVEEIRVIPEIDTRPGSTDSEHVSRTGYFVGHGLRSNVSYSMRGYTHPLPKTQATVHVFGDATPTEDNVAAFSMTPELRRALTVFQGPVAAKFADIYDDLRLNVHRIQGRMDMQIAYDLVWHSVIEFTFNGSYVRRGWTETMVMGDSGQGKTEMALELLRHYRMGSRIQGESSSGAGLIGGLEKMGETWILGWGKIPLNDRRLLIVDETQGLSPESIENLSDVRATGVAEITKIRTEKTNARCRLVWLANPADGRPLAQQNQGVQAISGLFKKPEDIRRLDFAITVASGDVALEVINQEHAAPKEPRYSSDLCRNLVLWAWSRRQEHVRFSPEATKAILSAATDLGRRYSSGIPLVEGADQRLKIARLSAAAAARVFSTDESGELVLVERDHVAFVVDYLDRIYTAKSMAYDEYSGQQRQGETLDDDERWQVEAELANWQHKDDAISFFRAARVFKKSELVDVVGWDDGYTKAQLRFLAARKLIRPTREGYVKTPVFIGVLRGITTAAPVPAVPSDEEDPF